MTQKYALLDNTGKVVNLIVWDGDEGARPPAPAPLPDDATDDERDAHLVAQTVHDNWQPFTDTLGAKLVLASDDVRIGDSHNGNAFVLAEPEAPRAPTEAQVRAERERLLNVSDWTQLADVPAETQETWRKYRQQLRDVPAQSGFPEKVKWPKAPS